MLLALRPVSVNTTPHHRNPSPWLISAVAEFALCCLSADVLNSAIRPSNPSAPLQPALVGRAASVLVFGPGSRFSAAPGSVLEGTDYGALMGSRRSCVGPSGKDTVDTRLAEVWVPVLAPLIQLISQKPSHGATVSLIVRLSREGWSREVFVLGKARTLQLSS